ncbi:banIM [Symbiodinium pilosum]|uniref:BanIM protein n=1 Tax=Symbiodinium pilosum TaxID=2952 RepID=A0A812MKQ3_SYMPI|nr:banIM [Symbiodinium pilosum]
MTNGLSSGFQQLFGSEINENPRRFILRNCNAQHLFEDVMYVMEGSGPCARHGGRCPVPRGEVDIFVGGFPCTPYSFCNPKRFKRNCFTEPAAAPFFEMRKFIAERRPRLVILENVRGLLAPNPETEHPPIDFILRGRNPENPEDCYQGTAPNADWGLSLIEGYGLRWDILYSYDWGLPQSRPRASLLKEESTQISYMQAKKKFNSRLDRDRACYQPCPMGPSRLPSFAGYQICGRLEIQLAQGFGCSLGLRKIGHCAWEPWSLQAMASQKSAVLESTSR